MPRKIRQLKTDLQRAGVTQVSQESSHTKWKHPLVADADVVLAGGDGDDAKPYQEKQVRELLRRVAETRRRAQS